MAKHQITIHENTGATKESAPYLGSYISKETLKVDAFAAKIAEKCGLPAIQVQAIVAGAFDAIEDLERESLVRVNLDGFTVCGIITGSFPTSDAAFDKERNALQLALRLADDIRNHLANEVPTVVSDASVTRLRVDNVMDLAEPRPFNLIHGKHQFRVAGFNMVLDDEGAEVFLMNGKGTTFDVVVDEVVSKQLFKAHTENLLEAGDYKLVVKSKAGDAQGPLQTAFRKVKYLRIDEPTMTIDSIKSEGSEGILKGEAFVATGENISYDADAGDTVTVKWTEDGEEKSETITPQSVSETAMNFDAVDAFDDLPDNTELTFEFRIGEQSVDHGTTIAG